MTGDGAPLLYLGCFGGEDGAGKGVSVARRDPGTGDLSGVALAAPADSPSFLARHPHRPVLYAVCWPGGEAPGRVVAWATTGGGSLAPLGEAGTGGGEPCHLAVHRAGGYLLSANYRSGSVSVHRLDPAGAPGPRTDLVRHRGGGPHPDRQRRPHAHLVAVDPDGDAVDAVDLGADAVFHYRLDPDTGRLHPAGATRTRPGAGPRHVARHGPWRYLVGELDGSLTCYRSDDGEGGWREHDRVPICADGAEGLASEVAVSADGRFVYAATRGPDRIATFAAADGTLHRVAEVPCGGHWPRHLALVGPHLYVANQRSGTVVTFRVDPDTGVPSPTGNRVTTPSPSCVLAAGP